MAVALELSYNGPGATSANYNQLLQRLGVSPGGRHPDPDCLFHWIAETPSGFRVTDVWTSRAQFDEFVQNTIGPIAQQLGIPDPSRVNETQIANFLTAGS
jgi:hypothetical protein